MRLAIIGSRDFDDYIMLEVYANMLWKDTQIVVSGGAKGADSLAKKYAEEEKLEYIEFLSDWDGLGKRASFIRNQQIVDDCDMVLAFWDGKSKGTEHTISLAKRAKKPTFIVYF